MNPLLAVLGLSLCASEVALAAFKRAGTDARTDDRGSLILIWAVVTFAVAAAIYLMQCAPRASFALTAAVQAVAIAAFVAGLGLRWYAIIYLGRYFTVNVAVAADHRVIDTGPYRHIRHPSYLGVLVMFFGYSLCTHNYASIALLMGAAAVVFMRRMGIEEAVLATALGERYGEYMRRTKRLIPAIY